MNRVGIIDFFRPCKRDKRMRCLLGTKEEDDAEEDDEESYPVEDYDYGDYETATITSDTDLIAGGSLPIFLAEPVDTFVVKGKPATLHCRAAHALQVTHCTCNNFCCNSYLFLRDVFYDDSLLYYIHFLVTRITATTLYYMIHESIIFAQCSFSQNTFVFISFSVQVLCTTLSSLQVLITHLAAI